MTANAPSVGHDGDHRLAVLVQDGVVAEPRYALDAIHKSMLGVYPKGFKVATSDL